MTLGDRIAVVNEGRVEQVGEPLEVYRRPATAFVARFVGSPSINLFAARLRRDGGRAWLECERFRIDVPRELGAVDDGEEVFLGVRPADVEIVAAREADTVVRIDVVENLGSVCLVHGVLPGETGGGEVRWVAPPERAGTVGAETGLRFARGALHVFEARTGRRLPGRE